MEDVSPTRTPIAAEVDLRAPRHNARRLRHLAGGGPPMAVVKADAYGHGAERVVQVLREEGVRHFAVARVPEALALRRAGLDAPILVFEAPLPAHLPAYAQYRLDVTVPSPAVAEAVAGTARAEGPMRAHVKIDTGMGRLGLAPAALPAVLRRLGKTPGVEVAGIWTHLATAGAPEGASFMQTQIERFHTALRRVENALEETGACLHVANTGALLTQPNLLHPFHPALVRVGLGLYGLGPTEALAAEAGLRPVMRLTSRVTHLKTIGAGATVSYGRTWRAERPTRIATVGAGYADGYPRLLSNRAEVGIRGHRFRVAGTVCMDMLMVDLGPPDASGPGRSVAVGDEVVLFGEGGPSAYEVASWAETIPYEICCAVSPRVPRVERGSVGERGSG